MSISVKESVKDYFNKPEVNALLPFNALADATAKITFWGCRVVEIRGLSGSIPLKHLTAKVVQAVDQCCLSDSLSFDQRMDGYNVLREVSRLYESSALLYGKSQLNLFSRLLCILRDYLFPDHNKKYFYSPGDKYLGLEPTYKPTIPILKKICAFSPEKFRLTFPCVPEQPLQSILGQQRIVATLVEIYNRSEICVKVQEEFLSDLHDLTVGLLNPNPL